jgi:ribonuclease R
MPISSKRIISFIYNFNSHFTLHQITKALLPSAAREGKSKHGKGRKRKKGSQENDAYPQIKEVLYALVSIGFLKIERKMYVKDARFRIKGKIRINPSGSGIIKTANGYGILVDKKFTNNAHNNDLVEADIIDYVNGEFFGNVVKIAERGRDKYFGRVTWKTANYVYFKLMDVYGDMEVCARLTGSEQDVRKDSFAFVRLLDSFISGKQECVVEQFFSSEQDCDVQRIISKYSLPGDHKKYEELTDIKEKLKIRETEKRKDYKNLFTITIDGERAKDFDDAISLEVTEKAYLLYVHIADVSSYVTKGSELDKEALKRGNSYYLGNSVIPMLPEELSNNLCSLKEGEKRLTMSVEIAIDKKGKEISHSFHRGIIKVDKRMTYVSADEIITGQEDRLNSKSRKLRILLNSMLELALLLKKARLAAGRVDLTLPDYELIYDNERFKTVEFASKLTSHTVIEEFMLTANEVVSRALTGKDIPSLYRVHEDISEEKMLALRNFFRLLGITLKATTNTGIALQRVVDQVKGKEYEQVVSFIILKSFMQAYYSAEPKGHFGLGFEDYTHFTSPIRRYPDLVVHRCLKYLIDNAKSTPPYVNTELEEIGENSSIMERIAQNAERDLFKLISCRFMEDHIGKEYDAIISGIAKSGFFVALMEKPVEGMVPLRFLTDDYYLIKEDEFTVIGRKLGKRFRLGDKLRVRLKEVSYERMRIDFEVV